jgi:hypothetical protein
MAKKLDPANVEKALRSAAYSATQGPTDAKTGRFTGGADIVLTRRDRLRRVVLLCCAFMRNLAYYRTGYRYPIGWRDAPLAEVASFWRIVNGNFIDVCVLEWCKLLGDAKAQHYWERVVSDKERFKTELLRRLGLSEAEFELFRQKMRTYRDRFIAHLDSEFVMQIPTLDLAKTSVEFYHEYVAMNEAEPADLFALPDTAEKLQHGYRECEEEAERVYRAAFGSSARE